MQILRQRQLYWRIYFQLCSFIFLSFYLALEKFSAWSPAALETSWSRTSIHHYHYHPLVVVLECHSKQLCVFWSLMLLSCITMSIFLSVWFSLSRSTFLSINSFSSLFFSLLSTKLVCVTNFNYFGIPLWEVNRRLDIALDWCPKGLHFQWPLVYFQIRQENIINIVKQTHLRNAINWRGRVSHAFLTRDAGKVWNFVLYVMKVVQKKWNKFSVAHEMALLSHTVTRLWCYTVQLLLIQLLAALCHGMLHPHRKALLIYRVCLQQAAVWQCVN